MLLNRNKHMTINIETYAYHTSTLTFGHPLHAGKDCYCKNCANQLPYAREFGSIYCKVCEDQHGEVSFEVWLHEDCPETGCGEHCPKDWVGPNITVKQLKRIMDKTNDNSTNSN